VDHVDDKTSGPHLPAFSSTTSSRNSLVSICEKQRVVVGSIRWPWVMHMNMNMEYEWWLNKLH
jgi:hypothetical protein